tara:strand:- start:716 stop:2881 length:2166 start_codon:yes stop_codon:yes gene_type:complete
MARKTVKPAQGEGKQDFLKRCAGEIGGDDSVAMAVCTASWNQTQLSAFVDEKRITLSGDVELVALAESEDDGPRRFSILAHTGKVIDLGYWGKFIIDLSGIVMSKAKIPALLEHRRNQIVGSIDKSNTDDSGFFVFGAFSKVTRHGRETLALADEGFPWQASIGVRALKILQIKEGESHQVNGLTVEGPIDVWLESSVFETSFCPFGADDDTAAIAMSATAIQPQEESMDKRLRMFLERRGLSANATDQEAWAFLEELNVEDEELNEAGLSKEDLQPPEQGTTDVKLDAVATTKKTVVELSGVDVLNLGVLGEQLGLSQAEVATSIKDVVTRESAELALYKAAERKNPAFGIGSIEMGMDEADKFRLAAADGIAFRLGLRADKPAPGYEEFRALSMHEFAKLCLEREGVATKGLTKRQLAQKIIRLSASGVSTSDFAGVFMDASHKRLLKAYTETASTWRPWCNVVEASDFKDIHGIALSDAPDLDLVGENGEYKTGQLKDKQESYRIGKYGKILSLTLEMIVNDDLRAFAKLPRIMGAAAKRKESDIVYGLLTGNPMMADGKALFSADHRNLSGGVALSSDSLGKERAAMRKAKGMNGANIDVTPAFLLVPTILEDNAAVILRSSSLPEDNKSAGVHNPNAGKLVPISDPRLDDASETAFYVVGDPNQVDTIEVAFLDGIEEPTIEENDEFVRDAVSFKVRHIFGAGAVDYVGMRKNPGA